MNPQTQLALAEHKLAEAKKRRSSNTKSRLRIETEISELEQLVIRLMDKVELDMEKRDEVMYD